MMGVSIWELLLVGLILFLVVGPSKLPGLAKQIGSGIRDFRRSLNDLKGSVSPDDEFVKAVREARQSVAEAKEAVRSIFDDEEEDGRPLSAEPDDWTPPGASPESSGGAPLRTRTLVRPAPQAPAPVEGSLPPAPGEGSPAPAPGEGSPAPAPGEGSPAPAPGEDLSTGDPGVEPVKPAESGPETDVGKTRSTRHKLVRAAPVSGDPADGERA